MSPEAGPSISEDKIIATFETTVVSNLQLSESQKGTDAAGERVKETNSFEWYPIDGKRLNLLSFAENPSSLQNNLKS